MSLILIYSFIFVYTMTPVYLYIWSYVYLCVFIEKLLGVVVSPVSDDNSSLWAARVERERSATYWGSILLLPYGLPWLWYRNDSLGKLKHGFIQCFMAGNISVWNLFNVVHGCKTMWFVNYLTPGQANFNICWFVQLACQMW